MATAYLATQASLGRQVVLKVLDTTNDVTSKNVERFMNEARIVASLRHPNIITIYDVGRHSDLIYISMEYIEGGDLKARMADGVAPQEALDIVARIASALDCAHKSGVIHRDVKPANILFRKDGTPLLTDFGIAKKLTIDHDLTSTGIFLGSPNYMAPEQAEDV
ncbi:MAG: serine/threonine protein kinase, partial [Gammaproteobacteria bacterium]|nr:serine/threonine protein kinase [Gammaproteobacteria bacterium]